MSRWIRNGSVGLLGLFFFFHFPFFSFNFFLVCAHARAYGVVLCAVAQTRSDSDGIWSVGLGGCGLSAGWAEMGWGGWGARFPDCPIQTPARIGGP